MNPCGGGLGDAPRPPMGGLGGPPQCLCGFIVFHIIENRYILIANSNSLVNYQILLIINKYFYFNIYWFTVHLDLYISPKLNRE